MRAALLLCALLGGCESEGDYYARVTAPLKAKVRATQSTLLATHREARQFRAAHHRCPTVDELAVTLHARPRDAWGHDVVIVCPDADTIDVISAGADGRRGTADDLSAP